MRGSLVRVQHGSPSFLHHRDTLRERQLLDALTTDSRLPGSAARAPPEPPLSTKISQTNLNHTEPVCRESTQNNETLSVRSADGHGITRLPVLARLPNDSDGGHSQIARMACHMAG